MIVYGDTVARENLCHKQAGIIELLREQATATVPIVRHQTLVAALIEAGELAQGWFDLRGAARGHSDGCDPAEDRLMRALTGLAGAVGWSWEHGFAAAAVGGEIAAVSLADEVCDIRHPEGFAHYALYPEAYWAAARRLAPHPGAAVIGLRSIGTTLAAMVAAALGAPGAETVRPKGHPFRRQLALTADRETRWAARRTRLHAVVDEGPGLSGSSFGAVGDTLERLGVARRDIVAFPGHAGDLGGEASAAHRERWQATRRFCVPFDALTGAEAAPHQRVEAWVADLTGVANAPCENLSAGRWRAPLITAQGDWPPADAQNEKLKLRLTTPQGRFLLRFVGLGRRGQAKHGMAATLAGAGFGLDPLGWRHGFLVDRWQDDARPMQLDRDRDAVLSRLPAYLGFRARHFPALSGTGAPPESLHAMARANIAEALGEQAAAQLDRWEPSALKVLATAARPVLVDGRLHPWEWLALPDGRVVKTDALDHHAAHDLVGAQDIAWDVAGSRVEWNLSNDEVLALADEVGRRAGRPIPPALLDFYALAYPAFQLGLFTLAAARADSNEGWRLAARATYYRNATARALEASSTKL